MNLRETLGKNKALELDEEMAKHVVSVYEKNVDLYQGKSQTVIIMLTADELNMRRDDLIDFLSEYYEAEE